MKHLKNIKPGDKIQLVKLETLLKNGVIKEIERTIAIGQLTENSYIYHDTENPNLLISKKEIENYGKIHEVDVVAKEGNYVVACDWRYVYPPSHILKVIRNK